MLQIPGCRAPGKANLPGTLGPHCRDLVPTYRAGCVLKTTVPAFSSFSELKSAKDKIGDRQPRTIPTKNLLHEVFFWGGGGGVRIFAT